MVEVLPATGSNNEDERDITANQHQPDDFNCLMGVSLQKCVWCLVML